MNTDTTKRPWYVAYGAIWTTPDGPDSGGSCLLKADRDEPTTSPVERDSNIALAVRAVNEYDALCNVAEAAKEMLPYIEMKTAHSGTMNVHQIMSELEHVQRHVSRVETAHHCGCAITTRAVDLDKARKALATLDAIRKEQKK